MGNLTFLEEGNARSDPSLAYLALADAKAPLGVKLALWVHLSWLHHHRGIRVHQLKTLRGCNANVRVRCCLQHVQAIWLLHLLGDFLLGRGECVRVRRAFL